MADTTTPNLGLTKIEIGTTGLGSKINSNMDTLDDKVFDKTGDTITGDLGLASASNSNIDIASAQKLLKARPITYKSLSKTDNPEQRHYGFIAEELDLIDPMLVTYQSQENGTKLPDGVQYERVIVGLMKLVQDLSTRVSLLESKK